MYPLPQRYTGIVLGLLAGVFLSVVMSGVMTLLQLGFTPDFWWQWWRGFVVAFLVSTPLSILLIPPLKRIAEHICRRP